MDVDLEGCLNGDKAAWDEFVQRCAGVIFAAVWRTMRDRTGAVEGSDVDDSVQEVFVRLIKDDCRLLKSYDPKRASLSTWLTLVARSMAIDHLRKRRLSTVPLEPADPPGRQQATEDPSLPLHLLTSRQRLVLRMLFDEGMTVAEAARTIGVGEQTIRSTKHKALSRLREHLGVKGQIEGGRTLPGMLGSGDT